MALDTSRLEHIPSAHRIARLILFAGFLDAAPLARVCNQVRHLIALELRPVAQSIRDRLDHRLGVVPHRTRQLIRTPGPEAGKLWGGLSARASHGVTRNAALVAKDFFTGHRVAAAIEVAGLIKKCEHIGHLLSIKLRKGSTGPEIPVHSRGMVPHRCCEPTHWRGAGTFYREIRCDLPSMSSDRVAERALLSAEEHLRSALRHANDVQCPARRGGRPLPDQYSNQGAAAYECSGDPKQKLFASTPRHGKP